MATRKKYDSDIIGSGKTGVSNGGSSIANGVNGIFGDMNNAGRNVASGASKIIDTIIKNAAGGLAAGKSPYDVAESIQGGGTSYTPPSTGSSTKSTQTVTMPTSVGDLPTYNSEYMDQLNALARQLTSMNYDDWTKGSQYQALADRYGANGRMSMQDVLGQVASRTGGLASSYATTAAQQQYNQYMAQLEEVARQMYSQERGDLMDNANLYRNLANDEYDRYRDSLSDYNARLKAVQNAAKNAYSGATYNGDVTGTALTKTDSTLGGTSGNSYSSSFSDIKRTISGRLASGNTSGASQLVESVWDDLTPKQKQEIRKMGFNVAE